MKSLSEPFINRPVMTMLVYLTVVVAGCFSVSRLPVSDMPAVDYPVIQVTVSYPGASPHVMAENVAAPLEQRFLQIPGIDLVTSNNSLGSTRLVLQFHLDKSIDTAATDVQAAINQATGSLPADLPSPPTFQKFNPNDFPVIYLGVISYSMTQTQLYDYAFTEIAQRIQSVPGVAAVGTFGSPRAVRIQIDPQRLYARGLTYDDITAAVRQNTSMQSAGQIKGQDIQLTVVPRTQLERAQDYGNLIIANKNGAPVHLRDVADCVDSIQSEDFKLAYGTSLIKPGSVGIVLAVTKSSGANSVAVAKGVQDLLPQLQLSLPKSISVFTIYDRSISIQNSLHDVITTLLIAFGLVVLVVYLFLGRIGDMLIPVVALPMSLLITFIVMYLCGYSLDNLSLMALTLCIGFLIDDAIVFLENMVRRMEAGEPVWTAAFNGAKEISFTILAMTLSLSSVFLPLIGMSGLMGRVFREFGVTIIVAVIASGVVSLTLTPMMCSRLLKSHQPGQMTPMERFARRVEDKLLGLYSPALTYALKHWYLSVLAYVVCGAGLWWFYQAVPKSFLPEGDSGFIFGSWRVDTATSPTRMHQYQDKVAAVISANPYVSGFITISGFSARSNSNLGQSFIALKDAHDRPSIQKVSEQLKAEMAKIPGVRPQIRPRPSLNISVGATNSSQGKYAYVLSSLDNTAVYTSAIKLMEKLRQSGKFSRVDSDYYPDNRQIEITVNRDQASNYGVPAANLAQTISNAYSQSYSYLIKNNSLQYWVIVEAAPKFRAQAANLSEFFFDSLVNKSQLFDTELPPDIGNRLVPFGTVAQSKVTLGLLAVNHFDGFTSVTIYCDPMPGVGIGEVTDFIAKTADTVVAPDVARTFQGDALTFRQTISSLVVMMFVALFIMYVILGILYESYVHPITVLSSIPVALVGGYATLWLFHSEASLYAYIGMFMLAGLVKKNGIMMIDFAVMRQSEGRTPVEAVHEACVERFRPIIMTTLAAFFGSLPLALGWGADAASRIPLGLTICGGLAISQLITLFVTPVTYLGMEWVQTRVLDRIPFLAMRKHGHEAVPT